MRKSDVSLELHIYVKRRGMSQFVTNAIHIPIRNLGIWQGELADFFSAMSGRVHRHGAKSREKICEKIDAVKTQILNRNVCIRKELEIKKEELRKAYLAANKDENQLETIDEWESTVSDGIDESY